MSSSGSSSVDDKTAKLEALRAKRAALTPRPDPEAQLDAAIAAEEAALALAEAQAAMRAAKGEEGVRWRTVETLAGAVIVERPESAAFRAFSDLENAKTIDVEKLVFPCVRYPSKEAFGRMLDAQPGILGDLLLAASELAGARLIVQAKK